MFMRESSCWTRFERSNRSKGTGSFLDRIFISDSNEETPKEMEVTVHDNENATGFYRLSTGQAAYFENIKPHNQSKEDWCIPEDMEGCDYLMMDPACEVNEKGTREKTMRMRHWKKEQARRWTWILMKQLRRMKKPYPMQKRTEKNPEQIEISKNMFHKDSSWTILGVRM